MPLFSFGYGHCCPNRYVRLDSRTDMQNHFGHFWSFEYKDTPEQEETLQSNAVYPIELEEAKEAFEKWEPKNR